jgi:hypothetical protein
MITPVWLKYHKHTICVANLCDVPFVWTWQISALPKAELKHFPVSCFLPVPNKCYLFYTSNPALYYWLQKRVHYLPQEIVKCSAVNVLNGNGGVLWGHWTMQHCPKYWISICQDSPITRETPLFRPHKKDDITASLTVKQRVPPEQTEHKGYSTITVIQYEGTHHWWEPPPTGIACREVGALLSNICDLQTSHSSYCEECHFLGHDNG